MVPLAVILAALMEVPVTTPYAAGVEAAAAALGAAAASKAPAAAAAATPGAADAAAKLTAAAVGGGANGLGSGNMFDNIAWAYDATNKGMSFGLDQFWRQTMLNECLRLERGDSVLDLATGTADVALLEGNRLAVLHALAGKSSGPAGSVVGIDPSIEMLRRGVEKVAKSGLPAGLVKLSKGDAQDLSAHSQVLDGEGGLAKEVAAMESDSVDKISMSFGIRNVPDRAKALREMRRVLRKRPSSRVCILEFSLPTGETPLARVAKAFISHGVPAIGKIMTFGRGGDEYKYLEESITKFPSPEQFAALMTREGLPVLNITQFAGGSVQLYHAGVTR